MRKIEKSSIEKRIGKGGIEREKENEEDSRRREGGALALLSQVGVITPPTIAGFIEDLKSLMKRMNPGFTRDKGLVRELKLPTLYTAPPTMTVARMISECTCKDFQWVIQGRCYVVDLRILELGGCDVVLGLDSDGALQSYTF
ncbi:unnamed protein product [Dovyalis caffra]|uniref:Uncharacterized protein n=1 Tax=Dovyalis caffra TaxID=77055 RepID=A0AAV1QMU7_9ROSI|nr:unnamed protein product [Dovyalis caffra]